MSEVKVKMVEDLKYKTINAVKNIIKKFPALIVNGFKSDKYFLIKFTLMP